MQPFQEVALKFTQTLAARDYSASYAMVTEDFAKGMSLQELTATFEELIPLDWGSTEPIEVGETMEDWPAKTAADVGWAYVSISGDVYSEALIIIVASEEGQLKVRDVEFGRP